MVEKSYRPRVSPPRYARLKNLSCFKEVKRMLLEGYPVPEIVKFIQEDQKEYTDVTSEHLTQLLYRFRKEEIKPAEIGIRRMPKAFLDMWKAVEKKIPEIRELLWLYNLQKERIGIDVTTEKNIKKLFATTHREIQTAAQLLRNLVDMKMDLGIKERDLGKLTIDGDLIPMLQNEAARLNLPELERVGLDPESRRRVLDLVEFLMRLGNNDKFDEIIKIKK